jgi:hypothetical protein
MKRRTAFLLLLAGTVLLCVALNLAFQSRLSRPTDKQVGRDKPVEARIVTETLAPLASMATEPGAEKPAPAVPKVTVAAPSSLVATPALAPKTQSAKPISKKPPIQDPVAREALSLVGIDADAEAYWLDAINDASLSSHERQDLIEDLNEEGFSDPKNLSVADLPLILNRIAIIEELAPDAMDKVNADAFAEAYKDLVNMYGKVVQR